MGRRRTGVNKARDIIRCCQTMDLSEQQIARALEAEQSLSPGSRYAVPPCVRRDDASGG